MRKPTIYEIKEATIEKSPYFFDDHTMKCFGQTMRSFRVIKSPQGNIYILAPTHTREGEFMGYTFRQFKDGDLSLPRADNGGLLDTGVGSLQELEEYIENH